MLPEEAIKYLGVMIDKKLKWNQHLKYLETKTEKFIQIFNRIHFMNKELRLEYRIRFYRQVYLPIITYGHKVWYNELKFKYQKEKLKKMQQRTLLSITKCYRTTSSIKLLKIVSQLGLDEEIEWMMKSRGKRKKI